MYDESRDLREQNTALRVENDRLQTDVKKWRTWTGEIQQAMFRYQAQSEQRREALEFYADENNWPDMLVRNKGHNAGDPAVAAIAQDVGDRARAAIEEEDR